jgi:hypothetical protein
MLRSRHAKVRGRIDRGDVAGPEVTRSGDKVLFVVGVSFHERLAAMQPLRRADVVTFGSAEWLTHDRVDETYFRILPTGRNEITAEEAPELAVIFGEWLS